MLKKFKKKYHKAGTPKKVSDDTVVKDFLAKSGQWEDQDYLEALQNGIRLERSALKKRDRKFWQMIQFFKAVQHLEGQTAEAGCERGLSSYLICHYARKTKTGYDGSTHHVFDSFKGLSLPVEADLGGRANENKYVQTPESRTIENRKSFLKVTQATLKDFPGVNYYMGWIPEVFADTQKRAYKFVHIDLDLYEPTYHSLKYFYPQVVSGGCMVIDDYGWLTWPGVKSATDQWAQENGCHVIPLITGNAVIFKK